MKHLWLMGLLLVSPMLWGQGRVVIQTPAGEFSVRWSDPQVSPALRSPDAVRQRILQDLRTLRSVYLQKIAGVQDRQEAMALTDEIEDLVNLLWQTARFPQGTWVVMMPSSGSTSSLMPMGPAAFENLVRQLEEESFSDDKLEILRTAAEHNAFTVSQVARLMDLFDFGDDRVEVVRILKSRIVDPENAHELLSHVEFEDEKQALRELLQRL